MSTRRSPGRVARLLGAALLLAASFPAVVAAAPEPGTCAAERGVVYTAAVPGGLRTPGTHRFEWRGRYTDLAGQEIVDPPIGNRIVIDSAAPAYPNTVLLRLFRNTALLADGSVATVEAMRPDQAARMYVGVSWLKNEPFFQGTFHLDLRYETSKNKWSAWQEIPGGPESSFCVQTTDAVWTKNYGWG